MEVVTKRFAERRFAIRAHPGTEADIEETRRPMYQFMIMNEYVGGPPILLYEEKQIVVLVGSTCDFEGTSELPLEILPAGKWATCLFQGEPGEIEAAREEFRAWLRNHGHNDAKVYQVHLMDVIEDETEQEFQAFLG